ncbi:hypothetical protein HZA33_04970 [Candidatus Pacearchaeota archaeon]|nr:hypothetical protein [Candidatus Pacearchaeota archaeon]
MEENLTERLEQEEILRAVIESWKMDYPELITENTKRAAYNRSLLIYDQPKQSKNKKIK